MDRQTEIVSNHLQKAMDEINRAFRLVERPSREKRIDKIWQEIAKVNLWIRNKGI